MSIVILIVGLIILIRYIYIFVKYIKTKEYKNKKFEGNVLGLIAYTVLTIFMISILIMIYLIKDGFLNIINIEIAFITGVLSIILYSLYYIVYFREKNRLNKKNYYKHVNNKLYEKYGDSEKYDYSNLFIFNIQYNAILDKKFNELVSSLTNEQISFFHPKEYNNILDVYSYLYLNDYITVFNINDSIYLICQKINTILKKLDIDITIKEKTIMKNDDQFIKQRRHDLFPTIYYDLNIINEYIKKHKKDYELIISRIYNPDTQEMLGAYLAIAKSSSLKPLFPNDNIEEAGERCE